MFTGHGKPAADRRTCPEQAMLSHLKANHLVARLSCLSLGRTRNVASTSNEIRRKSSKPPKTAGVTLEDASDTLSSPAATLQHDASAVKYDLAGSLNRYSSLPPLPPIEKWLSHFPYSSVSLRDRISLRTPETAISVAHSFINSKKTSTGNPKVIVEAFPGVRCLKVLKHFSHPV
jgi:hypothetical protein